jgi:hypothetical protein
MLGLDYSGGRPGGAAIYAAGYRFVVRYLENGLGSGRVNLNAAEVANLHANGIAVALVWESQANRAMQGRAAGAADAAAADRAAKASGVAGLPIYFAIDFDIPDYAPTATSPRAKLGACGDYFDGVATMLPHNRIGVYGGYWAVRRTLDAGLATWAWQTVAWSGGQTDPRIHLYQRAGYVTIAGVQCDVNETRQRQFGQNPPGDDMSDLDIPIQRQGRTDITLAQFVASADDVTDETRAQTKAGFDALKQQVANLAAKVEALTAPAAPQIDLDALAAKVASHIHLTGNVVAEGDQPVS